MPIDILKDHAVAFRRVSLRGSLVSSEMATAFFVALNSMLTNMNNRITAGETAKTKKGWGLVAVIGFTVALTMGESLIMAAIGTAMLAAGAYLGGYMNETLEKKNTVNEPVTTAYAKKGGAA